MSFQPQSRLISLPDELLYIILSHIPLDAFLACHLTCRRLNNLSAESVLWRRHCLTKYRYWKPERPLDQLSQAPPATVNWKKLLEDRRQIDHSVTKSLEDVLVSQTGRIAKLQEISQHGFDSKDELLRHLDVGGAAEDVLARRYWSAEALGCLERSAALEEWSKIHRGEEVALERALGAFDLMITQRPPETLDQISRHLDDLAQDFKVDNPNHEEMTAGVKARTLASFLISKRITSGNISGGGNSEHAFRRLKNTLISITLCDEEHASIPIIAVAIYCCVARRLGLDAHPCAYPVRVLAMVFPPIQPSEDEDSKAISEPIYLDIYDNVAVLPLSGLRQQLLTWGVPYFQHAEFLRPASTGQIVERNARNIQESLTVSHSQEIVLEKASPDALRLLAPHREITDVDLGSLRTIIYPDRANYAVGWYNIFSPVHRANPNVLLVTLRHLAAAVREDFRPDVTSFLRYAIPLFGPSDGPDFPNGLEAEPGAIAAQMQQIYDEDATPPTVQGRDGGGAESNNAVYRVGQVFRHRRYGYTGAITGWDTQCKASHRWISSMGVDSLPRGREQCFYHVLVDDDSMRYVAEENVDTDGYESMSENDINENGESPPEALLRHAGKFFKRWDGKEKEFVSNVRDQYPDD